MRRATALLLLVTATGCVDFDAAFAQCAASGRCNEPDGGHPVVVRFPTIHHAGGGVALRFGEPDAVLIPDPLDARVVEPVARDAGRADFAGAPARFAIRAARAGTVVHCDTALERLDLTLHVAGRPDVGPADAGTVWTFDPMGLPPGTGAFHAVVAGTGVAQPLPSTRDGGTVVLDWSGLPRAPDDVVLTQRGTRLFVDDAGAAYDQVGVARVATVAPFAPAVAFGVPPVATLPVDWRRDEFRALLPHPAATTSGSTLTVSASVFGRDGGVASVLAPLGARPFGPDVTELRPRAVNDGLSAVLDFAQPYPPDWPLVVTAEQRFRVAHDLPDGGETVDFAFARRTEAVSGAIGPVQPGLALPTGASIDVTLFGANQVLATAHPLVAWNAPAGVGLRFTLTAVRHAPDGTRTIAATIHTTRSSVRIPEGVLTRGARYVFHLATRSTGADVDPEREPFAFALPVSENELVSGLLTLP